MSEGPSPEQQGSEPRVAGHEPPAAPAGAGSAAPTPGESAARVCESCGAALKPDQDWCLHCGAGADDSRTGPGWRAAAAAIGASAVLALGAAAAAYAAFKQGSPSPTTPVPAVAQTPPATTTTTTSTTSTETATTTTGEGLPATGSEPPKIPGQAVAPESGGTTGEAPRQSESETQGESKAEGEEAPAQEGKPGTGAETVREDEEEACKASRSAEGESSASAEGTGSSTVTTTTQTSSADDEQSEGEDCASEENTHGSKPAPILLEAEDASTYDPNAYPESDFASPELAIDGIATTAWTAAPAPELAPKVQAGLLLDLEGERRIAKVGLISRTLGMTVQIYGTTQRKPPKSITAAGWEKLSGVHLVEQRSSSISLRHTPKIRQLLVWVLRAPEVEPEVEGEEVEESVAINEVALYEPK